MPSRTNELFWAMLAILLITLLYTGVVFRLGSIPAAQSFFGHSLGVLGFLLMLMTETLYSLRKRSRSARWGKMVSWLKLHIFTGLVGPYLVLLHTSWKFNGLAGVVMLLTIIIVISGFFGRYIYTAVPRTADGVALQAREIAGQIRAVEDEMARMEREIARIPAAQALAQRLATLPALKSSSPAMVLGRVFTEFSYRLDWYREQRQLSAPVRAQAAQLERLASRRRALRRQIESLAMARRLLAIWHTVHIPLGVTLFTVAFVHIAAAVYFASLIH